MKDLFRDQEDIVLAVMGKVKEFMECEDLSTFKPLRMTITGAGGSGKSVVINTIVTLMRKMFNEDDVTRIAAPTGAAAFNVRGSTVHCLIGDGVSKTEYTPNTMGSKRRMDLIKRFKILLALIIDERSLLDLALLGTASRKIAETICEGGHNPDVSWGGLPIVILVGDDFQLPCHSGKGAFDALENLTKAGPMTRLGQQMILECSRNVMCLEGSKRIQSDRQLDKGASLHWCHLL